MTPMDLAKEAFAAAADRKAVRPVLIDLRGQSDICDFQFICSGSNAKQTQAIANAIEDRCRTVAGIRPAAIEGKQSGHWILMDYGATVIHIFFDYMRDYYAIEELWQKGKFIKLDAPPA